MCWLLQLLFSSFLVSLQTWCGCRCFQISHPLHAFKIYYTVKKKWTEIFPLVSFHRFLLTPRSTSPDRLNSICTFLIVGQTQAFILVEIILGVWVSCTNWFYLFKFTHMHMVLYIQPHFGCAVTSHWKCFLCRFYFHVVQSTHIWNISHEEIIVTAPQAAISCTQSSSL